MRNTLYIIGYKGRERVGWRARAPCANIPHISITKHTRKQTRARIFRDAKFYYLPVIGFVVRARAHYELIALPGLKTFVRFVEYRAILQKTRKPDAVERDSTDSIFPRGSRICLRSEFPILTKISHFQIATFSRPGGASRFTEG